MKPVAKRCANFALFGMIAVLLGTFAPEVRCISPGDQVTDPDNWIVLTSCDELPDEITEMEANVEVTRKIICEDPTAIEVSPETHIIIRSQSEMLMRNIHFIVPRGSKLTLEAKDGIYMQRDEDLIDIPFFSLSGKLALYGHGWIPQHVRGDTEDLYWAVTVTNEDEASVFCEADIKYTETSLAVASPTERQKKAAENLNKRLEANAKGPTRVMSSKLKARRFRKKRKAVAAAAAARYASLVDEGQEDSNTDLLLMGGLSALSGDNLKTGVRNNSIQDEDNPEPGAASQDQKKHSVSKPSTSSDIDEVEDSDIEDDSEVVLDLSKNLTGSPNGQPVSLDDATDGKVDVTDGRSEKTHEASGGGDVWKGFPDVTLLDSQDTLTGPVAPSIPVTAEDDLKDVDADDAKKKGRDSTGEYQSRRDSSPDKSSLNDDYPLLDEDLLPKDNHHRDGDFAFDDNNSEPDNGHPFEDAPSFSDDSTDRPNFSPWTSTRFSPLSVGERLRHPYILSERGKTAGVFLETDGSIMLRKKTLGASTSSLGDKLEAEETVKEKDNVRLVLPADGRKVENILGKRKTLAKEHLETILTPTKRRRGPLGWLQRRRERAQEAAREHVGKVEMTLTDRGCVIVTVDGQSVISRSGKYKREWRNRFPWRRRRGQYEIYSIEDGMEIRLNEERVWGVTACDSE